ncbi:DUF4367 domain-containing protein [Paenibacillus hexagrammi]|uniref:DUF4367 domain-containing protein n=1 Tax=Paenibacillus hexagrammi TaxID=2908839 RepID=A0ABY3SCU5_9BACL|nr:DUF4367 domain-containing protein [Paenibacillus sp. YPD9-1]UJF31243.1 DUF4367 domain-containing protein [Paenibacillus sp. YPD9-1]
MMKIKFLFIIVLAIYLPGLAFAESKYHKLDSRTLTKIKKQVTFKMLLPQEQSLPRGWTVEVKNPFPLDINKPIRKIRLHYFDKNEHYLFGLEQYSVKGRKVIREDTNGQNSRRSYLDDFGPSTNGIKVFVNNCEGRFVHWALTNGEKGGFLWWIQDDTYIEMESLTISETEMLRIANLLK